MEELFNIPLSGPLFLEHTFYYYNGEPILFVCKDRTGKRYLCSCCRLHEEWIIKETSTTLLLRLMDNKIAIRDAFIGHAGAKFFAVWDGKKFDYSLTIPDDVLPKAGANLDLPQAKASEFAALLRRLS